MRELEISRRKLAVLLTLLGARARRSFAIDAPWQVREAPLSLDLEDLIRRSEGLVKRARDLRSYL